MGQRIVPAQLLKELLIAVYNAETRALRWVSGWEALPAFAGDLVEKVVFHGRSPSRWICPSHQRKLSRPAIVAGGLGVDVGRNCQQEIVGRPSATRKTFRAVAISLSGPA